MVYIYAVSILFLIYIQVYHGRLQKTLGHEKRKQLMQAKEKRRKSNHSVLANLEDISEVPVDELTDESSSEDGAEDDVPDQNSTIENERIEKEEVQEYIILKHGTASMSHEGTSFYLRLGCLGKYSYISLN